MKYYLRVFVALTMLLFGHSVNAQQEMQLTSVAFSNDGEIPKTYTCDDQNISPPIAWVGAPKSAQSFALIMTDNDALSLAWQHWVVYDIPAKVNELSIATKGIITGKNSSGDFGYLGPCPPDRGVVHQYNFVLFALDIKRLVLSNKEPTAAELTQAMNGHIVAQAMLNGQYTRGAGAS
jgi:Raf kinase inhibitor-like YbhB/YbcL family protein